MKPKMFPLALERPDGVAWDVPSRAISAWAERPMAAEADNPRTISIYEPIGADWMGEGVTVKRIAGALRKIGSGDVTVNINSPGGDLFEGLAIYNSLVEHPGDVTVKVMGIAASAASIIAMAGDRVEMGKGSFLMIHNAWGVVLGNRNDFRAAAQMFDQFDAAMAEIYHARTGIPEDEVSAMMDAETFMRASEAIDRGFAEVEFDAPEVNATATRLDIVARNKIDVALAKAGMARSERRRLVREAIGTHDAAETATQDAGFDTGAAMRLLETLKAKGA